VLQPGKGFNIDVASLDPKAVAGYVTKAKQEGIVGHLLAIIPDTFISAFAKGDLLQVLLIAILTGFAISRLGELGEKINNVINAMAQIFFGIIRIIVRAAPVGALGAMAFTVGAYGVASLVNLLELIVVLPDEPALRSGRARHNCAVRRLFHSTFPRVHQGRVAHCAWDVFVRNSAPPHDPKDGAPRRLEVGGRVGRTDGLQLQS